MFTGFPTLFALAYASGYWDIFFRTSHATVAYGEPRMTQDIDMVIDNHAVASRLEPFIESLNASDFLFDADAIRLGVERRSMFQLLDSVEALKLDIYAREMIAGELARSQIAEVS